MRTSLGRRNSDAPPAAPQVGQSQRRSVHGVAPIGPNCTRRIGRWRCWDSRTHQPIEASRASAEFSHESSRRRSLGASLCAVRCLRSAGRPTAGLPAARRGASRTLRARQTKRRPSATRADRLPTCLLNQIDLFVKGFLATVDTPSDREGRQLADAINAGTGGPNSSGDLGHLIC